MMTFLLFLSGLAMAFGAVLAAFMGVFMSQGIELLEEFVYETEVIYCDNLSLTEIEPVCDYWPLMLVPFEGREIIQMQHPEVDRTIMIFEDATKEQTFRHLEALGHARIPGTLEGYVELPEFIQDELGFDDSDPSEFAWSVYFLEGDLIVGFLESDLELERVILYIPDENLE